MVARWLLLFGLHILVWGIAAGCDPQSFTEGGFEPPASVTNLAQSQDQRIRLGIINFDTSRLQDEDKSGWIRVIEHELQYKPPYEGHFDVVPHGAFLKQIKHANGIEHLEASLFPSVRQFANLDYIISLDERFIGRHWVWQVTLHNGYSGAHINTVNISYTPTHMRWMLDRILSAIQSTVLGKASTQEKIPPPEDTLLGETIRRFDRIGRDCEKDRCFRRLEDFEWIKQYNAEFFSSIIKNDFFIDELSKEADTPIDQARLAFLNNRPMEVSLTLQPLLAKSHNRNSKLRYLEPMLEAAILLDRPYEVDELRQQLSENNASSTKLDWADGWMHWRKQKWEQAIPYLNRVHSREPERLDVMNMLEDCFRELDDTKQLLSIKISIARQLMKIGDYMAANVMWIEALDINFNVNWLGALELELITSVDRKNLATMLTQQSIVHDKNEAYIFLNIAKLKLVESDISPIDEILEGALQIDPADVDLLQFAAEFRMDYRKNFVGALNFIERIPEKKRDPLLESELLARMGKYSDAEQILKRAKWPAPMKDEIALRRAELLEKNGEPEKAKKIANNLFKRHSNWADLHFMKARLLSMEKREKEAKESMAKGWQLRGRGKNWKMFSNHTYFADYSSLILPHPLSILDKKSHLHDIGKVVVLDGRSKRKDGWISWLAENLTPYLARGTDKSVGEIRQVLKTRYEVVESDLLVQEFRSQLHPSSPNHQTRFTAKDMLQVASSVGADAVFVIGYEENADIDSDLLVTDVRLYFFSGDSDKIFVTGVSRQRSFFDVYKFNRVYIAVPFLILPLLLLMLSRFSRMTKHLNNPMLKAKYYIDQQNFAKAAVVLDNFGYQEDFLAMLGHVYAQEGDHVKAFEAFCRSQDFDNAALALRKCPDIPKVNNLAAEMYLMSGDFDSAESYFKKEKNLLGLAKVYDAKGKKKKAGRTRAQYFFELNNPDAAVEEYRKIADFNRAGALLFYYHRYTEAEKLFEKSGNEEMARKSRLRQGQNTKNGTTEQPHES